MSVSYTLRMPDDLKRHLNLEAIKRDESVANLVIAACWQFLEEPHIEIPVDIKPKIVDNPDETTRIRVGPSFSVGTAPRYDLIDKLRASIAQIETNSMDETAALPAVQLCPKVGYNEIDGESYRCRLAKGHKGNCAPGEHV